MSCGLPSVLELPDASIAVDKDGYDGNNLAFKTPTDNKIQFYIIWYKIYPRQGPQTEDKSMVDKDLDYFRNSDVYSSSDIVEKDFHELYPTRYGGNHFENIGMASRVTIQRHDIDKDNYIQVAVDGGQTFDVRRSVVEDGHKPFYGKFSKSDADISRRANEFKENEKGFIVAFMAQSAYIADEIMAEVRSQLTTLGFIVFDEGFEDT